LGGLLSEAPAKKESKKQPDRSGKEKLESLGLKEGEVPEIAEGGADDDR